jgi:hypothetical protein
MMQELPTREGHTFEIKEVKIKVWDDGFWEFIGEDK